MGIGGKLCVFAGNNFSFKYFKKRKTCVGGHGVGVKKKLLQFVCVLGKGHFVIL